jgi:hypothetical protein
MIKIIICCPDEEFIFASFFIFALSQIVLFLISIFWHTYNMWQLQKFAFWHDFEIWIVIWQNWYIWWCWYMWQKWKSLKMTHVGRIQGLLIYTL